MGSQVDIDRDSTLDRCLLIEASLMSAKFLTVDPFQGCSKELLATCVRATSRKGAQPLRLDMQYCRYQLEGRIGSGADGEVWQAQHRLSGGRFAAKVLFQSAVRSSDAFSSMKHVWGISHPHILSVVDICQ